MPKEATVRDLQAASAWAVILCGVYDREFSQSARDRTRPGRREEVDTAVWMAGLARVTTCIGSAVIVASPLYIEYSSDPDE